MAEDDIIQRVIITATDEATPVLQRAAANAQASTQQIGQSAATAAQSFAQATSSISALGQTLQQALNGARDAAKRFGASASELAAVEKAIREVASSARDSGQAFHQAAASFNQAQGAIARTSGEVAKCSTLITGLSAAAKENTQHWSSLTAGMSTAGQQATQFAQSAQKVAQTSPMIAGMSAAAKENARHWSSLVVGMSAAGQQAAQVGQKIAQTGQAAAAATPGVSNLRQQMAAFTQTLTALGAGGPLTQAATALASLGTRFGAVGAAIGGLGIATGVLTKLALDAAKAAEGVSRLSDVSGTAASEISEIQNAFRLGGVSTEQFSSQFTALAANLVKAGQAVREAKLQLEQLGQALKDLQLQSQQRGLQAQGLELQTHQIGLQTEAIAAQLAMMPQLAAMEAKRAALSERTTQNQLAMMELEDKRRDGMISEQSFLQEKAKLTKEAREQQKQALRQQIEEAKQRQQMAQEEQERRRRELENQLQALQLQKDGIELQKKQLEQADKNAKTQEEVLKLQQERQQAELKLAELAERAAGAASRGREGMAELADIFQKLSFSEAQDLGKRLGFDQQTIDLLRRGGAAFRELDAIIKRTGLSLSQLDVENLKRLSREWEKFKGLVSAGFEKIGAIFAPEVEEQLRRINEAIEEVFKKFKETGELDLTPLVEALLKAGEKLITAASELGVKIAAALIKGIANGIRAEAETITFDNIFEKFQQLAEKLKRFTLQGFLERLFKELFSVGSAKAAGAGGEGAGAGAGAEGLMQIEHAAVNAKAKVDELVEALRQVGQITFEGVTTALSGIASAAQEAAAALQSIGRGGEGGGGIGGFGQSVQNAAQEIVNALAQLSQAVAESTESMFAGSATAVGNYVAKILEMVKEAAEAIKSLMQVVDSGAPAAGAAAAPFARGGMFTGKPGIDTNLAWLTSGEFIMSAAAVRYWGPALMHMINAMQRPVGFAAGGMVLPAAARAAHASIGSLGSQASSRTLNLVIEGKTFAGLKVPEQTAIALERFSVKSQLASAGRKPNWKR